MFTIVSTFLVGAALGLAASVLSSILRGYVLSILWGWFVVPFGVPPISVAWAIGISVLVTLLTTQYVKTEGDSKPDFVTMTFFGISIPLIAWFIGFIVHSFFM